MIFYRAFGVTSGEPLVQSEEIPDEDAAPPSEMTNGITSIEVHAHGDSPTTAFVSVYATTPGRAITAWRKVVSAINTEGWFE